MTFALLEMIIMMACSIALAAVVLWIFVVAIRTGEFRDMFFDDVKMPWAEEDKKRKKAEAKAKAAKKWWEA